MRSSHRKQPELGGLVLGVHRKCEFPIIVVGLLRNVNKFSNEIKPPNLSEQKDDFGGSYIRQKQDTMKGFLPNIENFIAAKQQTVGVCF